jgi:hypothetical protein
MPYSCTTGGGIQMKFTRIVTQFMVIVVAGTFISSPARAHGGALDQYGCHHQTSDNTYHCHNSSSSSSESSDSSKGASGLLLVLVAAVAVYWLINENKKRFNAEDTEQEHRRNWGIYPYLTEDTKGLVLRYGF